MSKPMSTDIEWRESVDRALAEIERRKARRKDVREWLLIVGLALLVFGIYVAVPVGIFFAWNFWRHPSSANPRRFLSGRVRLAAIDGEKA